MNGAVIPTAAIPFASSVPVAKITTSAPTLRGTAAKEKPALVAEPITAKKWPGVPLTIAVVEEPGATTVSLRLM